jgi:SNW domain-containing protein 1
VSCIFFLVSRNKLQKDRERDISEKIALGMPNAGAARDDVQFDQRLFNQTRGMDSGFAGGDDEVYNVYDKPWRQETTNIYRPTKGLEKDVYGDDLDKLIKDHRFVPDKEFSGADRSAGRRDGPVQFEKEEEEDIFGLNKFLQAAKKGQKRPAEETVASASTSKDHDRAKKSRRD